MKICSAFSLRKLLVAAGLLLLLAGCATGPHVRTDYDPGANFGQYKTWGWYSPIAMEQSGYSSWISERIKTNVRREMDARGYRYVESAPDLMVNFQGAVQERRDVYTTPRMDFQYFWSYRARAYVAFPIWYDEAHISRYTEGTLTVDLVDAKQNRMVWTGDAIGRVVRRSPEERAADIDAAITAIFAKYPYRAGDAQPMALPRR